MNQRPEMSDTVRVRYPLSYHQKPWPPPSKPPPPTNYGTKEDALLYISTSSRCSRPSTPWNGEICTRFDQVIPSEAEEVDLIITEDDLPSTGPENYKLPPFKPMCLRREVRGTPYQSRSCSPQAGDDRINRDDRTQENWSNTPPCLRSFQSTPTGSLLQAYPFPTFIPINVVRPPLKLGIL